MKYCVVKNKTTEMTLGTISGPSENVVEMLQNAANAGFAESEVEILTEEEYLQKVEAEPKPPQPPTDKERIEALEMALLEVVLGG